MLVCLRCVAHPRPVVNGTQQSLWIAHRQGDRCRVFGLLAAIVVVNSLVTEGDSLTCSASGFNKQVCRASAEKVMCEAQHAHCQVLSKCIVDVVMQRIDASNNLFEVQLLLNQWLAWQHGHLSSWRFIIEHTKAKRQLLLCCLLVVMKPRCEPSQQKLCNKQLGRVRADNS
jgi:hypothetical protein